MHGRWRHKISLRQRYNFFVKIPLTILSQRFQQKYFFQIPIELFFTYLHCLSILTAKTTTFVFICISGDWTLRINLRASCNAVNYPTYVLVTTGKRTSAIIYHIIFAIKYKLRGRLINGSLIKYEFNYFSSSNFKRFIVLNRPRTNF